MLQTFILPKNNVIAMKMTLSQKGINFVLQIIAAFRCFENETIYFWQQLLI